MQDHKKSLLLLLALLIVVLTTTLAVLHGQYLNGSISHMQRDVDEGEVPVADYTAPLPSNPQERAKRLARGRRHNMKTQSGEDAKRFMITEDRESSYGGFPTHAPAESALPVAQSDAVVIGEVTDARAFLSEDKTAIYSEFAVNVSEVLKNNSPLTFNSGESITAERGGGAVRFPSGKVIRNLFDGKPMPRVGRRYVLFLKYSEEGRDFSIITGYELRAGRVIPLDGLFKNGNVVPQLVAHQSYRGADEITFLNQIREAVHASTGGSSEGVQK